MDSVQKLVHALESTGSPKLVGTIRKAKAGAFSDTLSESATPITDLVQELMRLGFPALAQRAQRGDFDATSAEWDAWRASDEGRLTMAELTGGLEILPEGTDGQA